MEEERVYEQINIMDNSNNCGFRHYECIIVYIRS